MTWGGSGVVGPGVSTWYTEGDPLQLQLAAKTFWAAQANKIPNTVFVNVPNGGETITAEDGVLTGVWTEGTSQSTAGTYNGVWIAGTGARIVWGTAGVTNGRRVRGSTYIVPMGASQFDTDGSLVASVVTGLQTQAQAVIVALGDDFCVWSRPAPGRPGKVSTISDATVPDKASWLRTRRT